MYMFGVCVCVSADDRPPAPLGFRVLGLHPRPVAAFLVPLSVRALPQPRLPAYPKVYISCRLQLRLTGGQL